MSATGKVSTAALALVVVSVLLIAIGGIWSLQSTAAPYENCADAETREHARAVLLDGIDEALKRQLRRTFESWMKDTADQPARAVRGMQRAMTAYIGSRKAAKSWNPPLCEG